MKTDFKFRYLLPNEPMDKTDWWKWLDANPEAGDVFHVALLQYFEGFDKEKHVIPSQQLDWHRSVFSHYHWVKYHSEHKTRKWRRE